jgi:hypothetical protein
MLLHALQALRPDCRFFWWARRTRVVDLVADLGSERVGFCICAAQRPKRRDCEPLALAMDRHLINRGFVLHAGDRASRMFELPILCVPRGLFMRRVREWMLAWRAPTRSWRAVVRTNRVAASRRSRRFPPLPPRISLTHSPRDPV